MKDADDEAFDELAKRQGDWGGGFQAKRQMAADKFQENAPLYVSKTAFRSWREFASDYERGFIDGMQKQAQSSVDKAVNQMAQPAQEPVAYVTGVYGGRFIVEPLNRAMVLPTGMALYSTPQHTATWVGLTDGDCVGMSAGDKVVAMWANRILKEKNT